MQLRFGLTVALMALAVALPATAASADGAATFSSPARDATLATAVPIEAQVTGETGGLFGGGDHTVRVRLANLSQQPYGGLATVDLQCLDGDCAGQSTWGGASFDPRSFAPFGRPGPGCNGGYVLQVQVDDGSWSGQRLAVSVPPSAPRDVAVEAGLEQAEISWTAAPEADVTGYRVERRTSSSWTAIGETGADGRSLLDDAAPGGSVDYRVVALRADGLDGGTPVPPCSDTGHDLATASDPVTADVRTSSSSGSDGDDGRPARPAPTPTETETESGGAGDAPADDGDEPVPAGDGDAGGGDGDADGGETAGDDTADEPAPRRRAGSRIAPPAAVDTSTRRSDVSVPRTGNAGGPQVAEERYYGQDEPFSEELDFGDAQPLAGEEGADVVETRTVRVPGALQSVLGEELELSRVLHPLAIGLLLLTLALHLRRWTREGATV